jgi:uncharacterized protein YjdB
MRHPVSSLNRTTPRALSRVITGLALGVALLTGSACQLITGPQADKVVLTIAPSSVSVGQQIQASAVAQRSNGNPMSKQRIGYKSSDPSIATVTGTGVITGVGPGTATITATQDGKSASQTVTVTPAVPMAVLITPGSFTLRAGGSPVKLTASPVDAQGRPITGGTVRWESTNTTVATVSSDGTVMGLVQGSADIIAESGGRQGVARITVTPLPVSSLTLAPNPMSVIEGATNQLVVTLRDTANRPVSSVGRNIVFVSSDQTIASVAPTGIVTGVREGSTVVVATIDGSVSGQVTVNVSQRNVAFVIFTSARNPFFRLGVPNTVTAVAVDSNQTPIANRLITYVSRNPAVLTVTTNGGQVTPVSVGQAWIIASAGGKSDSVFARVTEVPIASVALVPLQPTVTGGQTIQFQAVLRDQLGNIVTGRPIEWATNNPALISISQTGLVTTAVSNGGTGAVTATVDAVPGFAEKVQGAAGVTVLPTPVASITVTPNPVTIRQGTSQQITVTMRDANGTEIRGRLFVAESSDPNVVQIDGSRQAIVGISPGTATVTVQSVNQLNQKEGPITTVNVTITAPAVAASRIANDARLK